jgi:hypothetical protein
VPSGGVRVRALDARVVGAGEVGGAAEQLRHPRAERIQHRLRTLARRDRLRRRLGGCRALGNPAVEIRRQRRSRPPAELRREPGVLRLVSLEAPAPATFRALACGARVPGGADLFGHHERLVRPGERLARERDFVCAERGTVALFPALLVRCAVADDRLAADQRGLAFLALRAADGARDGIRVVAVHVPDHLPAVGLEAPWRVISEPAGDLAVDRDAVVVVEADQLAESPRARERAGLVRDALHQAAVAQEHPGEVVDDLVPRPVEGGRELLLGERHADGVGEPLPQRPGRGLDADLELAFRMARGARPELAEVLQFVDAERVAGQVQHRIEEHRAVPVREHEAVAVCPVRVPGVVLQEVAPQDLGDVRHAHRHPGMTGIGALHGVHAEGADGVGELAAAGHSIAPA